MLKLRNAKKKRTRTKAVLVPQTGRYVYEHPDQPGVFVSRQRIWQIKKVKEGCCQICGQPRNKHEIYCDDCRDRQNEAQNIRNREARVM